MRLQASSADAPPPTTLEEAIEDILLFAACAVIADPTIDRRDARVVTAHKVVGVSPRRHLRFALAHVLGHLHFASLLNSLGMGERQGTFRA